jgi:hypothetical protein
MGISAISQLTRWGGVKVWERELTRQCMVFDESLRDCSGAQRQLAEPRNTLPLERHSLSLGAAC